MEEKLKEEVLYHQRDYVDSVTRRLKAMKLPAADPHVSCLWIFGGEASSHTAQILAIFDWASKYFKLGGEYPVLKLPGWLTTFINVTSMSRFPDGLLPLPAKRTAMNFPKVEICSPGTWQWMADLLQYLTPRHRVASPGCRVPWLRSSWRSSTPTSLLPRNESLGTASPLGRSTGWSCGPLTPRARRPTTNAN